MERYRKFLLLEPRGMLARTADALLEGLVGPFRGH